MANSFNNCWSTRTIATLLAKIPEGQNGIFFFIQEGGKQLQTAFDLNYLNLIFVFLMK
jgi:hypothetical protein